MTVPAPLIVLDDDPTGAQSQAGVPVALDWSAAVLDELATRSPAALHILTNTRALSAEQARNVTHEAAIAAVEAFPDSLIVLRGDSTLRAHLLPEYLGLRDAAFPSRNPVLMLVPALPAAGRITRDGKHHLRRGEELVPLDRSEYAHDGEFAYASARLLDWAEERSRGFFSAKAGSELGLQELRSGGPDALAAALGELSASALPAVLAVDAENDEDIALAAAGLRIALERGEEAIVRGAPAFVGALSGAAAHGYEPLPAAAAVLVLCGSHVPRSTRQLARLSEMRPESVVWVSSERLASSEAEQEIAAAAEAAGELLDSVGLAVVATSRDVLQTPDRITDGAAIASGVAAILARLRGRADVVVSKGGITSAVNIREGLGSEMAEVLGPVQDGISLWSVETPEGRLVPFIVFPGNVGGDGALADLVGALGAPR